MLGLLPHASTPFPLRLLDGATLVAVYVSEKVTLLSTAGSLSGRDEKQRQELPSESRGVAVRQIAEPLEMANRLLLRMLAVLELSQVGTGSDHSHWKPAVRW